MLDTKAWVRCGEWGLIMNNALITLCDSLLRVGFLSQCKYNASATQIVLPILHYDSESHFSKFGVLFHNYEIIFSTSDHHNYQ